MQGNVFAMNLELKSMSRNLLVGTLADQMGMMSFAPVFNTEFDGVTFKADVEGPDPAGQRRTDSQDRGQAGGRQACWCVERARHGHRPPVHRDQEVTGIPP